jgi:hypothetical protein
MIRYLFVTFALFGCGEEVVDTGGEVEKEGLEGVPSAEPAGEPATEPAAEPEPIRMVGVWNAQTLQGQPLPYTETSDDGSLTFNAITIVLPNDYNGSTSFDTTVSDSSGAFTFPYPVDGTATGTDLADGQVSVLLSLDDGGMGVLSPFTITCMVTETTADCTSDPDEEGNTLVLSFLKSEDAPEPSSEPDTGN